ncbi:radical SAM superfamily domain-containing protein [Phthorimaea operculella]|nr:radical SAM superfamily domain-containing protein [Phthorimaea operculella]
MRAHVNNFVSLRKVTGNGGVKVHRNLAAYGRRLHSDAPNVAAVRASPAPAPVPEPRAPLTDLLGRRHNYLRISLTERCNLRCQYCMPVEGVPLSPREKLLTREELSRVVRSFAALGVDKVRLTGGEPTLRADLADIIQQTWPTSYVSSQYCMPVEDVPLSPREKLLTREELSRVVRSFAALGVDKVRLTGGEPTLRADLADIIREYQYCIPAEGVPLSPREKLLTREELSRVVRSFAALGVDKVRLTGGEPTLRADLADIIQQTWPISYVSSQYCMPVEGVPLSPREKLLTREELSRVVRSFAALGVDKVRLTGGEPTLRADLADIIQQTWLTSYVSSQYCMPYAVEGVPLSPREKLLTREELSRVVRSFAALGVDKVRLTGGEPTLRADLADIIQQTWLTSYVSSQYCMLYAVEGVPLSPREKLLTREELSRVVRSFAALGVDKVRLTGGEPTLRADLADIIQQTWPTSYVSSQYCMPVEGVPLSPREKLLTREELSRVVRSFAALGVDKVRLTGGEPTLRADLADIIQDISSVEGINSIGITTNGLVLTRKLPALQRAGLTHINVSLDSLKPHKYEQMARRAGLSRVLAGIDLALQLDYRPVKINVVLMKGFNDDEICDFVEYTRDREVEVRFIEFMPFSGNAWDDSKLVPHKVAVKALMERFPDALPCLPRPNDTSRGSVGFISSMTKNFCSTCNRLRLTADGNLKVCLFGASEVSIRDAIRLGATDYELEQMIRVALRNKKPQHAALPTTAGRGRHTRRALRATSARLVPRPQDTTRIPTTTSDLYATPTLLVPEPLAPARITKETIRSNLYATPATLVAELQPSTLENPLVKRTSIFYESFAPRTSSFTRLRVTQLRGTSAPLVANFLRPTSTSKMSIRSYSSDEGNVLTHLDSKGKARMVDVGNKEITARIAEAECTLRVGGRLLRLLRDARLPKGDALTVAQIAGVVGAKKTAELIPMCHPLPLDCVRIKIELPKGDCEDGGHISVHCEVRVTARTGAEMEALTGAATAALTLYDMCKSVDKTMRITNLRVVKKTGGKSGDWPKEPEPEVKVRELNKSPIKPKEAYVPTNIMYV